MLISMFIYFSTSKKCHPASPMRIFPGHQCLVQYRIYTNITRLHLYSCQYDCMVRPWCAVINENVVNNYCLLSNGPCMGLVPDGNFHGIDIKKSNREQCLVWEPNREASNPAKMDNTCINNGVPCIVGRSYEQSSLLPGNYAKNGVYSLFNGTGKGYATGQSLDVQPGCTVTWVPFTGGDPLPEGTVEGGFLVVDGTIQHLYIASVMPASYTCAVYGYYNPSTGLGYAEYMGAHIFTSMNLMIV